MARQRDYAAEYARRIARGFDRGLTRTQARGHPGPRQSHIAKGVSTPRFDPTLEEGLRSVRNGRSLKDAARSAHVAPERLRSYLDQAGRVEKQKGRLTIRDDVRPRSFRIFTKGSEIDVVLPGYDQARIAGEYMSAVGHFLRTNDVSSLKPFTGMSVRDAKGKRHVLETRPNVLYRLNLDSTETYEQIYRIVA